MGRTKASGGTPRSASPPSLFGAVGNCSIDCRPFSAFVSCPSRGRPLGSLKASYTERNALHRSWPIRRMHEGEGPNGGTARIPEFKNTNYVGNTATPTTILALVNCKLSVLGAEGARFSASPPCFGRRLARENCAAGAKRSTNRSKYTSERDRAYRRIAPFIFRWSAS